MDIQRLRNLTTGRLHTEVSHVYKDIELLTGVLGIMTHQIPNAMRALEPWLRQVVTNPKFWDGRYDIAHTGVVDLPTMTAEDRQQVLQRFNNSPSPLAGKKVIVVRV